MKNLFKLIDYNKIIAQIEESRKGAVMIVIFICLCCAAIDYIFRKHGIVEDWFTQSYLIIGFFSTCIWAVKTYNAIANEIERKQRKHRHLQNICNRYKIILESMTTEQLKIFINLLKTDTNIIKLPTTNYNHSIIADFEKLGIIEKWSILHSYHIAIVYEEFLHYVKNTISEGLEK